MKPNLKIIAVQFYQGVRLNGNVHTFLTPGVNKNVSNMSNPLEYVITEEDNGVLICQGNKAALTSWNNIQGIEYDIVPHKPEEYKKSK